MKIIYSRWDEAAKRWRNKPALIGGGMDLLCAQEDHSHCMHGGGVTPNMKDYVYTSTVALRSHAVQSILFTKETVIVKLVPK
jgi:hypothetical protein